MWDQEICPTRRGVFVPIILASEGVEILPNNDENPPDRLFACQVGAGSGYTRLEAVPSAVFST